MSLWLAAAIAVAAILGVVLRAVVVSLLAKETDEWIGECARRIAHSGPEPFDPDAPPPPQLKALDKRPLTALWVAVHLRRDAGDLPMPALVRHLAIIGKSTTSAARLWLPTAVGGLVLTIELPLLLLVATWASGGGVVVTGLALALAIIVVVDAGPLALATTASANARERRRPALSAYAMSVGLGGCALLIPVWSGALGSPFGISDATWAAARDALIGLAPAPLLVALRRYFHGLLIGTKRTDWIVLATVTRIMVSVVLSTLLAVIFGLGAFGIGIALTVGVAVEVAIVAFADGKARLANVRGIRRKGVAQIARLHLPLSMAMLLAVAPASALLVALALTDGSRDTVLAWLVVFIGPLLIASATLDLEALAAAESDEPPAGQLAAPAPADQPERAGRQPDTSAQGMLTMGLLSGAAFTGLWLALGPAAGLDTAVVWWLAPFPLLCVTRELLRGWLVARGGSKDTVIGVAAGSLPLLFTFVVAYGGGMQPIGAVALAVSVGAAAEAAALGVCLRRLRADAAPDSGSLALPDGPPGGGPDASPPPHRRRTGGSRGAPSGDDRQPSEKV